MTMKPQPIVVTTICSLCGEPWGAHGDKPDTLDCIRLLKAKVAAAPPIWVRPTPVYPVPYWHQTWPYHSYTVANSGSDTVSSSYVSRTPAITATCSANT